MVPTCIGCELVRATVTWLPIALLGFFFLLPSRLATAQTFQFLPEIDGYYKINSAIRFDFQAKETREAGDPTQAEVGPSLDFFVKPLVRLKALQPFMLAAYFRRVSISRSTPIMNTRRSPCSTRTGS